MAPTLSRPPVGLGRVKGTAVRAGLTWYASTYGPSVLARLGSLASPELRVMLRLEDPELGIMPSSWYDTAAIGELLDLLDRAATPSDSDALMSKLAQAIAQDNVTGVYRSLFRLVARPAMLEAHAQRVWRTYIDEGTLTVHVPAPGTLEAQVDGWSRHHVAVCRFLRPLFEHLLRAVGYTALVVDRVRCVGEGDGCCAFEGSWVAGDRGRAALVLAHGAGAPQTHKWMVSVARALADRSIDVVTFNFLYAEAGRKAPDRPPVLEATWRAVIAAVRARSELAVGHLFLGGKSMGGRIATHVAAADEPIGPVEGLVLLGYPLHPPGKPQQLRAAHLPRVKAPMLFVQGERDAFGTPAELAPIVAELPSGARVLVIEGGDHSLARPKSSGESLEQVIARVAGEVARFALR